MKKITVQFDPAKVEKLKATFPSDQVLHDLLDRNDLDAGAHLMRVLHEIASLVYHLNVDSVQFTNDEPECHACGDMGRCNPTLENPDGVVCPCVVGEP